MSEKHNQNSVFLGRGGPAFTLFLLALAPAFLIILSGEMASLSADPSFDCAKASTSTEMTICGNAQLSRLDSLMAEAYNSNVKANPSKKIILRDAQRSWIKFRDTNCLNRATAVSCLTDMYNERIAFLRGRLGYSGTVSPDIFGEYERDSKAVFPGVYGEYEYERTGYSVSITVNRYANTAEIRAFSMGPVLQNLCEFEGRASVAMVDQSLSKGSPVSFSDGTAAMQISFGDKFLRVVNFGYERDNNEYPRDYFGLNSYIDPGLKLDKTK